MPIRFYIGKLASTRKRKREEASMADIFRKKALDQAASPDRLDDYIRVSNPSVWLLLGAICAFVLGVGIWCFFGNIADTQPALVHVEGGTAVCCLDQSRASELSDGDKVEVSGVEGTVVEYTGQALPAANLTEEQTTIAQATSEWLAAATVSIDLPDGDYAANVTVKEYKPLDLLLNRS